MPKYVVVWTGKTYGIFVDGGDGAVVTPYGMTFERKESALKVRDMLNEEVDNQE
jgi:hypothetical protein